MLLSYYYDSSKDESSIYALLFLCEIKAVPTEIIMNAIILLLLLVIFTFYAPKEISCASKAMSNYYSNNVFEMYFKYF